MNLVDILDTPRLYTGLAEFAACMIYVLILKRKQSGQRLYLGILVSFIMFMIYQHAAGLFSLYFWIPGMIGAILLMYLFLYVFCDTALMDIGFCCVRAFVLAEFAASLQQQLYVWIALFLEKTDPIISMVVMIISYLIIFPSYFLLEKKHMQVGKKLYVTYKELFAAIVTAASVFIMSNLSFVLPNTPFSAATNSLLYVRTLVDFGGIVMLYAQQERREEYQIRSENESLDSVLRRQYDQFRVAQDNMELLRREFHDLKHYMIALRSEEDPAKREQYLSEMEHAIQIQETFANTGNHVLDVVLTTKNSYCIQKNITLNCMTDGTLINHLHVKDICSIFGNALDNAIECVQQYEDPEKRLITLSMSRKNNFVLIQCENYSENELPASGELPKTTKNNTSFHGYGLKSIQTAAQKYNGSMTLHSAGNWFTLQILLPVGEIQD